MPPEVLGEIFVKLLEDDDADLHHSDRPLVSRACHSNPILLGHVCSYWRNVALHTPQLWSRIYILKPKRSQVQMTRVWLERASGHPLELSMWATASDQIDESAACDIMLLFMKRRHLWKRIDFTVTDTILQVLSRISGSSHRLSLLRSATLWISRAGIKPAEPDPSIEDTWKTIHACQTLRYVDWRTCYGHSLPEHCPWDQLTGITLSSALSFSQVLEVLRLMPKLVSLRVHSLFHDPSDGSQNISSVLHSTLRVLDITSRHDTGPLLRLLSLPALVSLKMRNNFERDFERNPVDFLDFLGRSNSQRLTSFELFDLLINEDNMSTYLQAPGLGRLTELVLCANITDAVVNLLGKLKEDGSHEILPRLRYLSIGTGKLLQASDGALSCMLASRFLPLNGSLKKISLVARGIGQKDLSELSRLRELGLEGTGKDGYI